MRVASMEREQLSSGNSAFGGQSWQGNIDRLGVQIPERAAALSICKTRAAKSTTDLALRTRGREQGARAWGGNLQPRGPPADLDKLLHLLGSLWPGIRATSPVPLEGQVAMVTINRRPSAWRAWRHSRALPFVRRQICCNTLLLCPLIN